MNKLGVYKITNTKLNKWYIGSSIDIERRWKFHKARLRRNHHENYKLQEDWNIHGEKSFTHEIYQECKTIPEMVDLEQSIIDEHFGKPYFYNLTPKVDWKENGWFHGEQTKRRIGISNKGKKRSKEFCDYQSKVRTGVSITGGWHHSEDTKKILAEKQSRWQKNLTDEQKRLVGENISRANKDHPVIKATNRKRSRLTYDLAQSIREDVSRGIPQRQLAKRYGLSVISVWKVIHGLTFVNP